MRLQVMWEKVEYWDERFEFTIYAGIGCKNYREY